MMNKDFLDLLEWLARAVRRIESPFGGMCVIFIGDPMQLPCVVAGKNAEDYFFFLSLKWKEMVGAGHLIESKLTRPHRQGGDPLLLKILREVRRAELSPGAVTYLSDKSLKSIPIETKASHHRVVLF
jgi:hypothetical protein